MDLKETTAVLAVIKTAYPRYYDGKTTAELKETASLWHTMLEEYPAKSVNLAVKSLIATDKFPPTIADIIERINFLSEPHKMSEVEAWGLVKQAIRNSTYHSAEEFDKLPADIQATLGGPEVLREWAMSEDESMENVIASNFMRSYRSKVDNRRTIEAIPDSVKALILEAAGRMPAIEDMEARQ